MLLIILNVICLKVDCKVFSADGFFAGTLYKFYLVSEHNLSKTNLHSY